MKKFKYILMLGALAVMNSCHIVDPQQDCETIIKVHFDYKFTIDEGGDIGRPDPTEPVLADLVDNIQLYIFDETAGNILKYVISVRHAEIQSGTLPVDVLSGQYTMVAWGLSRNNLPGGGFANVQMVDPVTNYYTPVVIGTTTLEEFRLLVLQPEDPTFADLYHAEAEGVFVPVPTNEEQLVDVDFNFTRYSNVVVLTINGLDEVRKQLAAKDLNTRADSTPQTRADANELPLDIYLTGKNGVFTHDGAIDERAVELQYNGTPVSYDGAKTAEVDIKTLRIDVKRHSVDPVILHIHAKDAVTYEEMHSIVPDINLLTLIQQVKNDRGQYLFRTQDQIDQAMEIPITFNITRTPIVDPNDPDKDGYELTVEITVAGWDIEDLEIEDLEVYTR